MMNAMDQASADKDLLASLSSYVNHPCFGAPSGYWIEDDPFSRPVRPQDMKASGHVMNGKPIPKDDFCSSDALFAQRVLTNVYEQDLMFLPNKKLDWAKYQGFYSNELRRHG